MAGNKVIGKVVTKASFDVEKKGLKNLKKFQKQIQGLRDQQEKINKSKLDGVKVSKKETQSLKRQDAAALALKRTQRSIGFIKGRNLQDSYKALTAAKRLSNEYAEGKITLQQMNHELSHQVRLLKTATAEARKAANARQKGTREQRQSSYGLGVGRGIGGSLTAAAGGALLGGAGIGAALGAGYAGAQAVGGSVDRQNQLTELANFSQLSQQQASVLAEAVKQNIPDISIDKLADQMKTISERRGEAINTYDPQKDSVQGEFDQAFKLLREYGYSFKQISEMSPVDTFYQIVQAGEALGKTQEQMISITEDLSDDSSKLIRVFSDSGKLIKETNRELTRYNLTLTDQQRQEIQKLAGMGRELNTFTESLGDSFTAGLGSSLGDGGQLKQLLADLKDPLYEFGQTVGWAATFLSERVNTMKPLFGSVGRLFGSLKKAITPLLPIMNFFSGVAMKGVVIAIDGLASGIEAVVNVISASIGWITDKLSWLPSIGSKTPVVPASVDVNNAFNAMDRLTPNNITNITNSTQTIERISTTGDKAIKVDNTIKFKADQWQRFFEVETDKRILSSDQNTILGNMSR